MLPRAHLFDSPGPSADADGSHSDDRSVRCSTVGGHGGDGGGGTATDRDNDEQILPQLGPIIKAVTDMTEAPDLEKVKPVRGATSPSTAAPVAPDLATVCRQTSSVAAADTREADTYVAGAQA